MDLAEFLRRRNITLDDIASRARETLALTDGDVLFACGSLVEGLGNDKSDVDFFLITSRRDIPFTSLNDVLVVVGSCLCDVSVIDRAAFEQVIEALARWAAQPRRPRSATAISEYDRRMLRRTWSGTALHGAGEFARLRDRIAGPDLALHKLDWARYYTNKAQVDLAGMGDAGDWTSMLFVAQDLLGHTVDALLAAHTELNPIPKWRAKLLERLPANWERAMPGLVTGMSALDRFLDLHCFPGETTARAILDFALRIVSFSRIVLASAEQRLLAPDVALPAASVGGGGAGPSLPCLDLDVAIRYRDGRFELFRLNTPDQPYMLSPAAYALLCLFDGQTSRAEGAALAARLWGKEDGAQRLEELLALVRLAGFEARQAVDEQSLQALLRTAT